MWGRRKKDNKPYHKDQSSNKVQSNSIQENNQRYEPESDIVNYANEKKVRMSKKDSNPSIKSRVFDDDKIIEIERENEEKIIREALRIPHGWFEEVYYHHGKITFGSPMTGNSWTTHPHRIGIINSMQIGDVAGFYKRNDGRIEIDEAGNEYGEYYNNVEIISKNEAIQRFVQKANDEDWRMITI